MELEELVQAVLTGTSPYATDAGLRVYALLADQNVPLPRVTYQRISNVPTTDFQGRSNLDQVRVQVDSWAKSYAGAKALARQVRDAMEAAEFKALLTNDFDDYEPETRLFRVRQDYRCWYRPDA